MTLDRRTHHLIDEALVRLDEGFAALPPFEPEVDPARVRTVLDEVAERLRDNFPYPHPLYAGQMLKPPHPVARLAYALSVYVNPNNHALDGGRASSAMEKEAVAAIATMFGWGDRHLGHLCGGGTMANLEALWVSGRLQAGRAVAASAQAHYTHRRVCNVLGLEFVEVGCDDRGRMDTDALEAVLRSHDVGTVVANVGATSNGAVDPLPAVLALRERHGFRVHVDAAYGGYFTLADNLGDETRATFDRLHEVDSIVVDPHKHGLQPYGCGCILFRNPAVGTIYKHDSPYTYFSSDELHLGEISLECSRPGASAVALWATIRMLPLARGGEFARGLEACRAAARDLHGRLERDPGWFTISPPELDIVVYAPRARRASEVSAESKRVFAAAASRNLHLALARLPADMLRPWWTDVEFDEDVVTCLRSCLMKPEHREWMDAIWKILGEVAVRRD